MPSKKKTAAGHDTKVGELCCSWPHLGQSERISDLDFQRNFSYSFHDSKNYLVPDHDHVFVRVKGMPQGTSIPALGCQANARAIPSKSKPQETRSVAPFLVKQSNFSYKEAVTLLKLRQKYLEKVQLFAQEYRLNPDSLSEMLDQAEVDRVDFIRKRSAEAATALAQSHLEREEAKRQAQRRTFAAESLNHLDEKSFIYMKAKEAAYNAYALTVDDYKEARTEAARELEQKVATKVTRERVLTLVQERENVGNTSFWKSWLVSQSSKVSVVIKIVRGLARPQDVDLSSVPDNEKAVALTKLTSLGLYIPPSTARAVARQRRPKSNTRLLAALNNAVPEHIRQGQKYGVVARGVEVTLPTSMIAFGLFTEKEKKNQKVDFGGLRTSQDVQGE